VYPFDPVAAYNATASVRLYDYNFAPNAITSGASNNFITGSGTGIIEFGKISNRTFWFFGLPYTTSSIGQTGSFMGLTNNDTSSFLNSLGSNEHTIIMRTIADNTTPDIADIFGNFTEGGTRMQISGSKLKGSVINNGNTISTDIDYTKFAFNVVAQRLTNVGGGDGRLDMFYGDYVNPLTKVTGSTTSMIFNSTGSSTLQWGNANTTSAPTFRGGMSYLAIFNYPLSDVALQSINNYIIAQEKP
jgi:hypothetical protein